MGFVDKSLLFRSRLRELLLGWFSPRTLRAERAREKLNSTLRNHWGIEDIEIYELIRENWVDPASRPETGSGDLDLQFVVFIDCELDVDWITAKNVSSEVSQAITRAEAIGGRQCNHLPFEQRLEFKRIVGHAIVAAIRGGLDEANKLADQGGLFLRERTVERSRTWTLSFAHTSVVFFALLLSLLFPLFRDAASIDTIKGLWIAMFGGLFGAFLSIIQKSGRGEWDAAAGAQTHCIEVFSKVGAGVLLGGIAFAITQSTHAPGPVVSFGPDHYSTFLFGFAAGFFERLIPKIVSSYPHKPKTSHGP